MHGWTSKDNNLVIALFRDKQSRPVGLAVVPLQAHEVTSTDVTFVVPTQQFALASFEVRVGPSRPGTIYINFDEAGQRILIPYPFIHIDEEIPPISENVIRILRCELDRLNMVYDNTQGIEAHLALHAFGDAVRLLEGELDPDQIMLPPPRADTFVQAFDKVEVPEADVFKDGTPIVLVIGQSNAANEGMGRHTPGTGVYNWNYIDGKYYVAADPLLGATGTEGSFVSRLGDCLVRDAGYPSVVLVPLAVGGTFVHDWTQQGRLCSRLIGSLRRLREMGRLPTHILWHQGEADASFGTPPDAYRARFLSMLKSIRDQGCSAPVYVAVATRCGALLNAGIREAQKSLANGHDVLAGPDTDLIDQNHRMPDGVHLAASGLDEHAKMWFEILNR